MDFVEKRDTQKTRLSDAVKKMDKTTEQIRLESTNQNSISGTDKNGGPTEKVHFTTKTFINL